MERFLEYSLTIDLFLFMILFSVMKWVVFRNTGIKEFAQNYLFWSHKEIFPFFRRIISEKEGQERNFYTSIHYGMVISFSYFVIAFILLIIFKIFS